MLAGPLIPSLFPTHLNRPHIRILRRVLVLVETILGEFAFPQVDAQLNKKDHHRLEGGDGAVSGPLVDNMFVEKRERGLGLLHSDKFLGAFAGEAALAGRWHGDSKGGRTECSRACCAAAAPCWAEWERWSVCGVLWASSRAQRGVDAEAHGGVDEEIVSVGGGPHPKLVSR